MWEVLSRGPHGGLPHACSSALTSATLYEQQDLVGLLVRREGKRDRSPCLGLRRTHHGPPFGISRWCEPTGRKQRSADSYEPSYLRCLCNEPAHWERLNFFPSLMWALWMAWVCSQVSRPFIFWKENRLFNADILFSSHYTRPYCLMSLTLKWFQAIWLSLFYTGADRDSEE